MGAGIDRQGCMLGTLSLLLTELHFQPYNFQLRDLGETYGVGYEQWLKEIGVSVLKKKRTRMTEV